MEYFFYERAARKRFQPHRYPRSHPIKVNDKSNNIKNLLTNNLIYKDNPSE